MTDIRDERTRMVKMYMAGTWCIFANPLDALPEVASFLRDGGAAGEDITLEIVELARAALEALPEFTGW